MKTTYIILLGLVLCASNTNGQQIISTIAGNGTLAFSGDGALATGAGVYQPTHTAHDKAGNLYIADSDNNRIRKVDVNGIITTIAGNGTVAFSGDGGPAIAAALHDPTGIAADTAGNIYIADSGNSRIRKVSKSGIISTIAGTAVAGFSGDGGNAIGAELNWPFAVTLDAANIYIADNINNRIRVINVLGKIRTLAGNGTGGYSGDGAAATAAQIFQPTGVAADNKGNVFIADRYNSVIRKVDHNGIITTVAGTGNNGYNGDGGVATATDLSFTNDVAVDTAGNIYLVDEHNDCIRKVDTSGMIHIVAGTPNSITSFGGDGGAATSAYLNWPGGIEVDAAGNLYIADVDNQRVRKVYIPSPAGISALSEPLIQFNITPSQSKGAFLISCSGMIDDLRVCDMLGQIVCHTKPGTDQLPLQIQHAGLYFITVKIGTVVLTKRVVVSN